MKGRSSTGAWYAVSVILAMQRRKKPKFLAFENVYLVHATSSAEARKKGAALGRAEARAQEGLTWNGEPAHMVFGGVRKTVSCAANPALPGDGYVVRLHDGAEATFSRFLVDGTAEYRKLLAGKPAKVIYEE